MRRQRSMEGWYENLITASTQAEECYRHDYEPLAPSLAKLRGVILDVGGGNGIARQFLNPKVSYIDLDPSDEWLRDDWLEVATFFPALCSPIAFVLGAGERLPFAAECFDAVLSLFSINHAAKPQRLIAEAERVLKPGGRLLLVAEDVEPRWRDLVRPGYRAGWPPWPDSLRAKAAATLRRTPWPVHPEHIAITEAELALWLEARLTIVRREWIAGWLTFEADKPNRSSSAASL